MPDQHPPACAKRQREQGGHRTVQETAEGIAACCSVSLLRAHRLARGWTLRQAVDTYRLMTRDNPTAPRIDQEQLRLWETHPDRRPRAATIDLLCALYRADARTLGLSTYPGTGPSDDEPEVRAPESERRAGHGLPPAMAGDRLDEILNHSRRSIEQTLARATASPHQLDLLEERLLHLRADYLVTPPQDMLGQLLPELDDLRLLASERQPATVQMRLSEFTAVLATLMADALMRLGRLRQSRAWYATARAAADDSTSTDLRARVRAQAAMLPYYYGPLTAAAALARDARILARHRPTPTAALAAAAEARALARQGDAARAAEAIRTSRDTFDRAGADDPDDAFAFPRRRHLLYLSGALTHLGHTRQAHAVQQEALTLYTGHQGIDPALLQLEQAICLATDRHLTEACRLAAAACLRVPQGQRTAILTARAHDVLNTIPPALRTAPAARELGDVLQVTATSR
ncbi:hypothetical protein ACIBCM_23415 [Streptomyces sp. NPDC051018]|uniref:hypothetical protein n=1 Tax=Streptomyces sp. NPDC051018 TaxID=3365639 RepID=UPI0037B962C3